MLATGSSGHESASCLIIAGSGLVMRSPPLCPPSPPPTILLPTSSICSLFPLLPSHAHLSLLLLCSPEASTSLTPWLMETSRLPACDSLGPGPEFPGGQGSSGPTGCLGSRLEG